MKSQKMDISLPLPLQKLRYEVTHTDVKKPSGLAYLFLVLLERSPDKNQTLVEVLNSIGINEALFDIFSDVIIDLCGKGIVYLADSESRFDYKPRHFREYTLGVFHFTEEGKTIFKKKVIPSTTPVSSDVSVFYDVATRSFLLNPDADAKPCSNSALPPAFVLNFPIDKDIEEYLNANKGSSLDIKKEEEIIGIEGIGQPEAYYRKSDCKLKIENGFSFDFGNAKENAFVESNYTASLIEKILDCKTKFKFPGPICQLGEEELSQAEFRFSFPQDLTRFLEEDCLAAFLAPGYEGNGTYLFPYKGEDERVKLVKLDKNGQARSFIPARVKLKSEPFGMLGINLLAIKPTEPDILNQLIETGLSKATDSFEDINQIVKIYSATKDYQAIESKMTTILNGKPRHNIGTLRIIRSLFADQNLKAIYGQLVKDNYFRLLNEALNEENYRSIFEETAWVIDGNALIKQSEALKTIAGKLPNESALALYEALTDNGFNEALAVEIANPIPEARNQSGSRSAKLKAAIELFQSIDELKKQLAEKDDAFDKPSVDRDALSKTLSKAKSSSKEASIFRSANQDAFAEIDRTIKEAERFNDYLNKASNANPRAITKEYIERKIDKGDYADVLIGLVAKLSSFLNLRNSDATASDLFRKGYDDGVYGSDDYDQLSKLRIARNDVAHPERDRRMAFNADDLRKWANIVFRITSQRKEAEK